MRRSPRRCRTPDGAFVTSRGRSLLTAVLLLLGLVAALFLIPVPYVILEPGPAYDTLGPTADLVITPASAVDTTPTKGNLRLVTVGVEGASNDVSAGEAIADWFMGSKAVVPRAVVYPPDQTQKQAEQQDTQDMVDSQDAATVAALSEIGPVMVKSFPAGSAADGPLQVNDTITAIAGTAVTDLYDLRAALATQTAGQTIAVGVTRNGTASTAMVTLGAPTSPATTPTLGIQIGARTDITVKIGLMGVGGPSAGMMFSLAIIDELTPGDLTGGYDIAGTGTIDDNGTVGEIGGIQQKLVGARNQGATIFLVPADNCAEAKQAIPAGMRLIKISADTGVGLHQAHQYLTDLAAGKTDQPGC